MALTANTTRAIQSVGGLIGGYAALLDNAPLAASQTIKSGDFLVYSSGLVAKSGAAPTSLLGISIQDVTTTATVTLANTVNFIRLIPSAYYVMHMTNGAATDLVSAQTHIGLQYGVVEDAGTNTGKWYVDQSNVTQKVLTVLNWADLQYQILSPPANVTVGTTKNAAVLVQFIASAIYS